MRRFFSITLAAALFCATAAQGANLQISPVSISFQPGQNAAREILADLKRRR